MGSPITTHVLDTANGHPAQGIPVVLESQTDLGKWSEVTRGVTDDDGRISDWLDSDKPAEKGLYRVTFEVGSYFESLGDTPFYSSIPIVFHLHEPDAHYHIPLLLSPYGYTTYRGS